jgi:hypothetical protein
MFITTMEFKKRGTLFTPVKSVVLEFGCEVHQPMKEINGKMYIFLQLGDHVKNKINDVHIQSNKCLQGNVTNPLEGNVLKVKVPYKYNKVTCKVLGNKVLQELKKGDQVTITVEYCGVWVINGFSGLSWKLFSLMCQ